MFQVGIDDFNSNVPRPIYTQEPQQPQEDPIESQRGDSEERHYVISR